MKVHELNACCHPVFAHALVRFNLCVSVGISVFHYKTKPIRVGSGE